MDGQLQHQTQKVFANPESNLYLQVSLTKGRSNPMLEHNPLDTDKHALTMVTSSMLDMLRISMLMVTLAGPSTWNECQSWWRHHCLCYLEKNFFVRQLDGFESHNHHPSCEIACRRRWFHPIFASPPFGCWPNLRHWKTKKLIFSINSNEKTEQVIVTYWLFW